MADFAKDLLEEALNNNLKEYYLSALSYVMDQIKYDILKGKLSGTVNMNRWSDKYGDDDIEFITVFKMVIGELLSSDYEAKFSDSSCYDIVWNIESVFNEKLKLGVNY